MSDPSLASEGLLRQATHENSADGLESKNALRRARFSSSFCVYDVVTARRSSGSLLPSGS